MEKCRVLELIGGSLTDGGAETLVKDYVLNLDGRKIETAVFVDWVLPETANSRILLEEREKIFTVYPSFNMFWRGVNRFFRHRFFVGKLRKAIESFNPDVIHVHLGALKYLSELKPILTGRRLFYTCHSTVKAMLLEDPVELAAAKDLVASNDMRLVALHDDMAKELNSLFGVDNSIVVKNGIDIGRFRDVSESKEEIRSSLCIPNNAFVVGHVGRFSEEKNHKWIIEVFKKVKEKEERAFLLLVGDGLLRDEIENLIRESGLGESVLMLLGRTDIPRILKAMDVFLFPSIFEGLGIALVEAQASGLRCIVSKNIPKDAFISNLVVPMDLSESVDAWCEAVLDRTRIGTFENRLDEYDIAVSAGKLEKLYLGEM